MTSWRGVAAGLALVMCAGVTWPEQAAAQPRAHIAAKARTGSHLYVLLGLGNNSPGLAEFGARMSARGIPTTVQNHGEWPALAQEAIAQYQSGRLGAIMIVGHSLGGSAAAEMAAELGRSGVPVQLVVMLDPVGASEVSANVHRSVTFRPGGGEDHFSVIAAHDRDLSNYVLGQQSPRGNRGSTRRKSVAH